MSTDLRSQLTEYGRYHREEQRAVGFDEIMAHGTKVRPLPLSSPPPRRLRRGLAAALAAALIVLLALGVIPFLVGDDQDVSPADTVVSTTAPATTLPPEDEATPTDSTIPEENESALAEPSDVFGFPAGVPIRDKYGFDITDTLVYIDEYIDVLSTGTPEASFDTSQLGVEEVLTSVEPSDSEGGSTPSEDTENDTEQLTLWAVRLEGTDVVAQFGAWLAYPIGSETTEPEYDADIEFGLNLSPGGSLGTDHFQPPESLGLLLVSDPGEGFATGAAGLPSEAAVVSTEYGDGTRVWQRPLFGMALFSNTTRACQPEPFEGQGCSPMELLVFDAEGRELFSIVTPISESDHKYKVTLPNGETYIRP